MRKLLTFLLLAPFIALGQAGTGLDISLEYLGTLDDANKEITKVQVNDTIVVAIDLSNYDSDHTVTFVHVDVQHNYNAYDLAGFEWVAPSDSNNSYFTWNDVKWTKNDNYDEADLWAQWSQQGGSYGTSSGWAVNHWTSITQTSDLGDETGHQIKLHFKVKDAGANHNYAENIKITMAKATDNILSDNANNVEYVYPVGSVWAHPTQYIGFTPLEDLDNNIKVVMDTHSNIDPTKIKAKVFENDVEKAELTFDQSGEIDITSIVVSSTAEYSLTFSTTYTDTEWTAITDDALTLSDAVLVLKEVGQFGHGGDGNAEFDYGIQYPNADTDGNNAINPQDAYNLIGHVSDALNIYPNDSYAFATTFPIVVASEYDDYTKQMFVDGTAPQGGHSKDLTFDFSNSNDIVKTFKTTVLGDVNMSHSSAVASNGNGVMSIAQSSPSPQARTSVVYGSQQTTVGNADADFVTQLNGDEVEVILTLKGDDVAALQLKLNYDPTKLVFKEAIFDTGNDVTNFASSDYTRVNMGSINQSAEAIGIDSTFKVIFDTIGTVDSPVGLVTIQNTDAANTSGERLILNLE